MAKELSFADILRVLSHHGVAFVVIGGLAAYLQGSPFPTEDIDVTPEQSAENLDRLSAALFELEARVRTQGVPDGLPFSHDATSLGAARVWNLTTRYGDLDISFEPSGTRGFHDLEQEAVAISIRGLDVRLASLADIVRSKSAANRDKDRRVLPLLRELLDRQHRQKR